LTHVRGNTLRIDRTDVIQDSEIQEAIENARRIEDHYFQLRAVAVLSLLRISGKRRGEVAIISLDNFSVNSEYLKVNFILEKKRAKTKLKKISTKQFPLDDYLTENVIEYLNYLETLTPKPKFWLPTGKAVFGNYIINPNMPLTGRHVFNIVREN
jgi:site-specific recombinase XerD